MNRTRKIRLLLLGLLTLAFCAVVWWTYSNMGRLTQLRAETARLKSDALQLQSQKAQLDQQEAFVLQRQALKQRVIAAGLSEAQWGSRVIQRQTSLVSRGQAEQLLRQLSGTVGKDWFVADSFDVAVSHNTEGLFTPPTSADRGFNVQVSGVVYFPSISK
jgi:hypothetical protein